MENGLEVQSNTSVNIQKKNSPSSSSFAVPQTRYDTAGKPQALKQQNTESLSA